MKYLICCMVLASSLSSHIIFDFNKNSSISNWVVVDDVVMGGKSNGSFHLNKDGNGVFSGKVSLENYGGFSSVSYGFDQLNIEKFKTIVLKLKAMVKTINLESNTNLQIMLPTLPLFLALENGKKLKYL